MLQPLANRQQSQSPACFHRASLGCYITCFNRIENNANGTNIAKLQSTWNDKEEEEEGIDPSKHEFLFREAPPALNKTRGASPTNPISARDRQRSIDCR